MIRFSIALAVALLWVAAGRAQTEPAPLRPAFSDWLQEFRLEAQQRGITEPTLERALTGLQPHAVIVERDRSQRELILTVQEYVERRVTPAVIRTARRAARQHVTLLRRVEREFGVPREVIVAIWGLESNFGRFPGVRPTIQALATLAWEGRRALLFRQQLLVALEILDRGDVGFEQLRGSWAGAMGQAQFLPSSYVAYARDFDGDGRKDIWRSLPDVFASIAYYLQQHGWHPKQRWGVRVTVPTSPSSAFARMAEPRTTGCGAERDLSAAAHISAWRKAGARLSAAIPASTPASLLQLGRRRYLVTANYEALLAYNCAHSYAMSVARLADASRPR